MLGAVKFLIDSARTHVTVVTVITLGCLLLVVVAFFPAAEPISSDSVVYLQLAEQINSGSFKISQAISARSFIQPGYPLLVSLAINIGADPEMAGLLISVLAAVVAVGMTFWLGKSLYGYWVGVTAAFLLIVNPVFIRYSSSILTESLFISIFISSLAITWWAMNRNVRLMWCLALGALVGYAYIIRLVGLTLLPVVFGWLGVGWWRARNSRRHLGWSIVAVLIGVVIVAGPYLYYLHHETGAWLLSGQQPYAAVMRQHTDANNSTLIDRRLFTAQLNSTATNYQINELLADSTNSGSLIVVLRQYWQDFSVALSYNLMFVGKMAGIILIAMITAIIIARKRKWPWRSMAFLASAIPFYLAVYFIGKPGLRYYLPLYPLFVIFASIVTAQLLQTISEKAFRFAVVGTMIVIIAGNVWISVFWLPPQLDQILIHPFFRPSRMRSLGYHFQHQFGAERVMMGTNVLLPYFAHGQYLPLPTADAHRIIQFARYREVDFIFMFSSETPRYSVLRHEFASISQMAPPTLMEVWVDDTYALYRVLSD